MHHHWEEMWMNFLDFFLNCEISWWNLWTYIIKDFYVQYIKFKGVVGYPKFVFFPTRNRKPNPTKILKTYLQPEFFSNLTRLVFWSASFRVPFIHFFGKCVFILIFRFFDFIVKILNTHIPYTLKKIIAIILFVFG